MAKLEFLEGDVIEALKNKEIDVLMHCCNAQGVMGSGIAKSIKEQFPSVFNRYHEYCQKNKDVLGTAITENRIINLIAQENYGRGRRQVHYGNFTKALRYAAHSIYTANLKTIGVPYKIASDRAGGDWEVIKELLESLPNHITIKIYKLPT